MEYIFPAVTISFYSLFLVVTCSNYCFRTLPYSGMIQIQIMTAVLALTELHTYDENENKIPQLPISVHTEFEATDGCSLTPSQSHSEMLSLQSMINMEAIWAQQNPKFQNGKMRSLSKLPMHCSSSGTGLKCPHTQYR
jgi:hypothetical protein